MKFFLVQAVTKSGTETLYLYDGKNRHQVMVEFLKRVLSSGQLELPEGVAFSSLVSIEQSDSTECTAKLSELLSDTFARACAFNINETEQFSPFLLQHELVNLAELMLLEHRTGVKPIKGFDPLKQSSSINACRNEYIAYFETRLRKMMEGTSRVKRVNIHNRVTAAMSLIYRPEVRLVLARLNRRPLPEFFVSACCKAWLLKSTGVRKRFLYVRAR